MASRLRGRIAAVAAIAALALTAACGSGGSGDDADASAGPPVSGGSLTFATDSEPTGWNIHSSAADVVALIERNVFDSLVAQESDGSFVPWLAESWQVLDGGATYEFKLKDGVKFHDGTPFDANAVKLNFDHIVDPDTKSQYAAGLLGPYTGTEVVDPLTVRVHFSQPFTPFLQAASTTYLGFYSPNALADPDGLNSGTAAVGTGPFTFGTYTKGQEVVLKANPDYAWGPDNADHTGPAYLKTLTIRFLPENSVRVGALTSGQVDVIGGLPPANVKEVSNNQQLQYLHQDAPGLPYMLFLNNSRAPFDDERVRQAFQAAIDMDQLVQSVYFGAYKRAWGPLGPTTPNSYDDSLEGSIDFDVDKANDLLDEAGWTEKDSEGYRTKDGVRLTASWPTTQSPREQRDTLGQGIQAAVKKVGIFLDRTPMDSGSYLEHLNSGDYDVTDWSFVRSDPDVLRLHLLSGHSPIQNAAYVDDPQVDAWVNQGAEEQDPAARKKIYVDVQNWVDEHAVMIPTYVPAYLVGAAADVLGLRFDPNAWPLFYDAWTSGG